MWGIELIVVLIMIAFNGVFAAYEIALASITVSRLHALVDIKTRGAKAALYMKENMEGSLAGVQLGITLVGFVAAATGGAEAEESIAPFFQRSLGVSVGVSKVLAIAAVVAPLTVLTIIFGELIPKVFALRNKEWVCLRLSPPMRWFVLAVWPIVWTLETPVKALMRLGEKYFKKRLETTQPEPLELHELRASVALARTSRLIGPQEERIILAAAALSHRSLHEVMLPASAISMLDVNASAADALNAAYRDMHTRFPVTERPGDPQEIIGYVNFKDIVAYARRAPNEPSIRGIMRSIPSLPAEGPIAANLERLIRERTHIALIRDTAGVVVGMVSLEDIIEELVGDIEDEFDRLPTHIVESGVGWIVGGGVTLDTLQTATGVQLAASSDHSTVSDWVTNRFAEPLRGGEVVEQDGLRVAVRKVRRHMVQEALVQRR